MWVPSKYRPWKGTETSWSESRFGGNGGWQPHQLYIGCEMAPVALTSRLTVPVMSVIRPHSPHSRNGTKLVPASSWLQTVS